MKYCIAGNDISFRELEGFFDKLLKQNEIKTLLAWFKGNRKTGWKTLSSDNAIVELGLYILQYLYHLLTFIL